MSSMYPLCYNISTESRHLNHSPNLKIHVFPSFELNVACLLTGKIFLLDEHNLMNSPLTSAVALFGCLCSANLIEGKCESSGLTQLRLLFPQALNKTIFIKATLLPIQFHSCMQQILFECLLHNILLGAFNTSVNKTKMPAPSNWKRQ